MRERERESKKKNPLRSIGKWIYGKNKWHDRSIKVWIGWTWELAEVQVVMEEKNIIYPKHLLVHTLSYLYIKVKSIRIYFDYLKTEQSENILIIQSNLNQLNLSRGGGGYNEN